MSCFDGDIDFQTVYMVDYKKMNIIKSSKKPIPCDDCLIVGVSRDALRAKKEPRRVPDVLCPLQPEYYKDAVERFKEDYPKIAKRYMSEDIDPTPIDNEIQDRSRSEYLVKYCPRELPFMSVNLARRARALQTLHLPDDVHIPATTQTGSYRHPPPDKYAEHSSTYSLKPKYEESLQSELRRILRVRTGETSYGVCHGLLGKVILEKNPFGQPREEPNFGRWRAPFVYTYQI